MAKSASIDCRFSLGRTVPKLAGAIKQCSGEFEGGRVADESCSDLDELVEKIRFYRDNYSELRRIVLGGKEMFDQYYDPRGHGTDIANALKPFLQ